MYGFTLSYVTGPLSVAAGVQQNSDNSNHKQTIFNANAVYAFSSTKLYVGYLHSKDDTGFVDSARALHDAKKPGIRFCGYRVFRIVLRRLDNRRAHKKKVPRTAPFCPACATGCFC
ncbi:hypothetical protein SAMN06265784_117111 [Paraburkholderia susongensis]|uniref:Porin n=1 Tax=Paraburkholderia susongensis TaxID=1515439 RepID=A0A1X7M5E5_9BURK|nr:hypothetical protein SAMN06265784_117111 [Paraburkholderia susongensis]